MNEVMGIWKEDTIYNLDKYPGNNLTSEKT
jgi:hypothetical protein